MSIPSVPAHSVPVHPARPDAEADGAGDKPFIHPLFNASDADVTVQSSDGITFRIHRKNIDVVIGAFPSGLDAGLRTFDFDEPDVVLENILQFLYPRRHSFPADMDFKLLMDIATAAEKYQIHVAIPICVTQLRTHIPTEPKAMLVYGLKYDHPEIIDEAAFHCVALSLSESIHVIPTEHMFKWICYHETWIAVFKNIQKELHEWGSCTACIMDRLHELEDIKSLPLLRTALAVVPSRDRCKIHGYDNYPKILRLQTAVLKDIDSFRPFTYFLNSQALKRDIDGRWMSEEDLFKLQHPFGA